MKLAETRDGVILEIFVKPRSNEFKIKLEDDEIVILCKEEPSKGKANKEIVKELSRILRKKVELVSGYSSKQKKLLIRGANKGEIELALSRYTS